MVTRKKTTQSASRTTAATARPSVVATPARAGATLPAAGAGNLPFRPLKPPLEAALDALAHALRIELDKAQAANDALRAEIVALRQIFDQHTHSYAQGNPGSGGNLWLDLGFLRKYLDGDKTLYDGHGVYWRGGPVSGDPSPLRTGTPGS